jgi:hypothetical protein
MAFLRDSVGNRITIQAENLTPYFEVFEMKKKIGRFGLSTRTPRENFELTSEQCRDAVYSQIVHHASLARTHEHPLS